MNPRPRKHAHVRARTTGQTLASAAALTAGLMVGVQGAALAQSLHRSAASPVGLHPEPAITGMVRDAEGAPQVGTLVELLSPSLSVIARTFTDDNGRYVLPGVSPGTYEVKASASFFLPTLRENLRLLANSRLVVNLTLNTLYQAFQWLPAQPRTADEPKDDWNWTLRLATNRPLLRVLEQDNGSGMVLVSDGSGSTGADHRVTVRSGSHRFGEGGMHQDLEVERDHDDQHQLIFRTDVGQTDSATLRSTAAYLRQLAPGTAMITVASFAERPDVLARGASGLQVFTLRSAGTMNFGPGADAEAGTETEAVHMGQTVTAMHPFAGFAVHHGATTGRYRIATSADAQQASELDRDATLAPRVSQSGGTLSLEQGLHQAVELDHEFGNSSTGHWSTAVSYFHDSVAHPVVEGGVAVLHGRAALSPADLAGGSLLYDPSTQLIAVGGQGYTGSGLLAIARDQLNDSTWFSLRYAIGQALAESMGAAPNTAPASLATMLARLQATPAPSVAASVGSTLRHARTEMRASYRWQQPDTLTPVAPFDSAMPDAYLSFHMRQPIEVHHMGVQGMQAIIDVRNLLAQGYRPFLSQDGSTLYFAQAERCVEAGLSFSF